MKENILNSRKRGGIGEEIACKYLINKGYEIVERNYLGKRGEIDIIAKIDDTLVFVEVKARHTNTVDYGFEAVNPSKRKKIINTAKEYVLKNELDWETAMRFDVIDIFEGEISHYKGAFA